MVLDHQAAASALTIVVVVDIDVAVAVVAVVDVGTVVVGTVGAGDLAGPETIVDFGVDLHQRMMRVRASTWGKMGVPLPL